jgi:rsbT co-antagonist protein RsbR
VSSEPTTVVTQRRIQRMIDVLSLISLNEFDPALTTIAAGEEGDPVAFLEESLNVFVRELAEARSENERQMGELAAQSRDLQAKLDTIQRQQLAISDLSTPIIELWDEILTLPVVGIVDTQRSLEMTTRLLQRVADGSFRCVIVDVTGVDVVDTMTADHFVKMIRSAQLLGAYCVVTGVSPEIAQTLVRIGVDMGGVRTLRTLKDGLKECFRHLRASDEGGAGRRRAPTTRGREEGGA